MKILVTGAKGFVGKNLCAQLKNIRDGKAKNYGLQPALRGPSTGSGTTQGPDAELVEAPVKDQIKVIGIRHGEKMYETLLTKEEAAKAIDMGNFYAVPADNRDLNYDKYFVEGDVKRATIEEFNSDNTYRLNLEETKAKIASLEYIQNELNGIPNIVK